MSNQLIGEVISKKMQKTATVRVTRTVAHPVYKKTMQIWKKYQVHDEMDSKIGDMVIFEDSKPYSKTKRWKIIEIITKKDKKQTKKSKSKTKKKGTKSK